MQCDALARSCTVNKHLRHQLSPEFVYPCPCISEGRERTHVLGGMLCYGCLSFAAAFGLQNQCNMRALAASYHCSLPSGEPRFGEGSVSRSWPKVSDVPSLWVRSVNAIASCGCRRGAVHVRLAVSLAQ